MLIRALPISCWIKPEEQPPLKFVYSLTTDWLCPSGHNDIHTIYVAAQHRPLIYVS